TPGEGAEFQRLIERHSRLPAKSRRERAPVRVLAAAPATSPAAVVSCSCFPSFAKIFSNIFRHMSAGPGDNPGFRHTPDIALNRFPCEPCAQERKVNTV